MTRDERRILARTEGMILYDHVAETGVGRFSDAVEFLHGRGKLHSERADPICAAMASNCNRCIYPGIGEVRCVDYRMLPIDRRARRKAARAVFKMIEAIEI